MKILFFLLLILLNSCVTPKQLYKNGDLNGAVALAVFKIKDGNMSDKHKLILESAYNEITNRELQQINLLKREGNPSNSESILELYKNIHYRQNLVQPILPVYIKKEYRNAEIKLINVDQELADAKNITAEYLYVKANNLLISKRKNDAREAYTLYTKIYKIFKDYKDIKLRLDSAKTFGINYVLLDYKNNSNQILPKGFFDELIHFNEGTLNTEWLVFTTDIKSKNIDKVLVININNINIGPEQFNERTFTEIKRIQDGYTYEYDSAGSIKKDANGKEIKNKKIRDVFAVIREIVQHKQGRIEGSYEIINYKNAARIYIEPISNDLVFHNEVATYLGDVRALSERTSPR